MVSAALKETGAWEGDHLAAIEQFHNKRGHGTLNNKRYADIGANMGYFTMIAAKRGYEVSHCSVRNAVLRACLAGNSV